MQELLTTDSSDEIDIINSAYGPVGDGCRSDKAETRVQVSLGRPQQEF